MEILFLSHCVPNPPDKGEKIRAFHEINVLAEKHKVHLACFARRPEEIEFAQRLTDRCASVHAEVRPFAGSLAHAAFRFAFGRCLNVEFYRSRSMSRHIAELRQRVPLGATIAYSLPMAPYAPAGIPMMFDMVDVDSEKYLQYSRSRRPGFVYAIEARRLRQQERYYAERAVATFLASRQETELFGSLAPHTNPQAIENGVDFSSFDAPLVPALPELNGRRFVAFVGTMDYYPNIEAARWFAAEVLPKLRERESQMEFLIVGNNPAQSVLDLKKIPGVTVTGRVVDVRPYVIQAHAVVAPLELARGIQNKVLEALALGRTVLASQAVCRTFGRDVPEGVQQCDSAADYLRSISLAENQSDTARTIRDAALRRFGWRQNLHQLMASLDLATLEPVTPAGDDAQPSAVCLPSERT